MSFLGLHLAKKQDNIFTPPVNQQNIAPQRSMPVSAPLNRGSTVPLGQTRVAAPLAASRLNTPYHGNPIVDALISGEKAFGTGIARVLPGGSNDIMAASRDAEANRQNLLRASNLFKTNKIDISKYQKLTGTNSQQSNLTAKDYRATRLAMPSKTGIALGAAGTATDLLSGGTLQGAKAAASAIKAGNASGLIRVAARPNTVDKTVKAAETAAKVSKPVTVRTIGQRVVVTAPSKANKIGGEISTADLAFRSPAGIIKKLHTAFGDAVVMRRDLGEEGAAMAKHNLGVANKLSEEEQANMFDVLEGKGKALNPNVDQAAKNVRKELNNVLYRGRAAGLDIKNRADYVPHILHSDTFKSGSQASQRAIDHLVKTGQAKNEVEAISLLRQYRDPMAMSPYQNLTKARALNLPDYSKKTAAIHQYLDRSYASIAHAKTFGPKEAKLNKYLNEIRKTSGDAAYEDAKKAYQVASNLTPRNEKTMKISRALTSTQGSLRLGTSSLSNLTQHINTAAVAGVGRTVKSGAKAAFNKADKEFVDKTGVTAEEVAHEDLFNTTGLTQNSKFGRTFRKVTAPGFEAIEKGNRATAAIAGRDMANSLAQKAIKGNARAAQRLADDFGITQIGKRGLTEEQQITAARAMVMRTQFRTGAQDIPAWAQTAWGRVLSQFKRYSYKQTQFLWNEVAQPAFRGDLRPLGRLAALGVPINFGVDQLRQQIAGSDFKNTPVGTAANAVGYLTGGDIVSRLATNLDPTSSKDPNALVTKVTKAIGGPTVSDVINGVKAGYDASKGKYSTAERFGVQHVPVASTVATRIVPYPASKDSASSTTSTGQPAPSAKDLFNSTEKVFTFNGKDMSAKDFGALKDSDKKLAAQNDPTARDLYDEYTAAKKGMSAPKLYAEGLSTDSQTTLNKFDHLTTEGKAKVLDRQNDAQFKYDYAKYENKKLTGNMTEAQDIKDRDSLYKEQIGSKYSKNIRDIYELAKKDLKQYVIDHPENAKDLLAYDQDLYNGGAISSLKFGNGFGSGSGGSSNKVNSATYGRRIAVKAPPNQARKVSVKQVVARARSSGGGKGIKVSRRKAAA